MGTRQDTRGRRAASPTATRARSLGRCAPLGPAGSPDAEWVERARREAECADFHLRKEALMSLRVSSTHPPATCALRTHAGTHTYTHAHVPDGGSTYQSWIGYHKKFPENVKNKMIFAASTRRVAAPLVAGGADAAGLARSLARGLHT